MLIFVIYQCPVAYCARGLVAYCFWQYVQRATEEGERISIDLAVGNRTVNPRRISADSRDSAHYLFRARGQENEVAGLWYEFDANQCLDQGGRVQRVVLDRLELVVRSVVELDRPID